MGGCLEPHGVACATILHEQMSLRSIHENRHLRTSFTFIGGVEAELSVPPKWDFFNLFRCSGAPTSQLLYPLRTRNLHQNVYFHECYAMTLSFIRGSTEKKSENQNLPHLFWKGVP